MKEVIRELKKAVKASARKAAVAETDGSSDALRFTQAALNAANAIATLVSVEFNGPSTSEKV